MFDAFAGDVADKFGVKTYLTPLPRAGKIVFEL
jgi:hypothetical protein